MLKHVSILHHFQLLNRISLNRYVTSWIFNKNNAVLNIHTHLYIRPKKKTYSQYLVETLSEKSLRPNFMMWNAIPASAVTDGSGLFLLYLPEIPSIRY